MKRKNDPMNTYILVYAHENTYYKQQQRIKAFCLICHGALFNSPETKTNKMENVELNVFCSNVLHTLFIKTAIFSPTHNLK